MIRPRQQAPLAQSVARKYRVSEEPRQKVSHLQDGLAMNAIQTENHT